MELKQLNYDNMDAVTSMAVREDQRSFVAPNIASLAEAYVTVDNGYAAKAFALYEGEKPVGFAMFGYDSLDEPDEPAISKGNYCLWRFMIDRKYQGQGLGKKALQACIDYLRTEPMGPAEYCWLSYEPENAVAKALYSKFGFAENGQMCGKEIVAVRKL